MNMNAPHINTTKILSACLIVSLAVGCSEKKQTYAEALQMYEAEMAELTRLEAKRDGLLGTSENLTGMKAARELLGSSGDLQRAMREATAGLVDETQKSKADKIAQDNLSVIDEQIEQQSKQAAKTQAKAEQELPELEKQIAKQQARVEAARRAKEALAPQ
jgi:hypothetical protein